MERAASEILRAIRGSTSQIALARRLGYTSNPVADWEACRRFPTIVQTLRAAQRRRIDVAAAAEAFHPRGAHRFDPTDLAPWLDDLRGGTSKRSLAARGGFSEHQVGRWLRGLATPRLPDFLRLVEALTGRVTDWVAALVAIDDVPSLRALHRERLAVRRLVFDHPWAPAVLAQVGARAPDRDPAPTIAATLGIPEPTVTGILTALRDAGVVEVGRAGLRVVAPLTVDARPSATDVRSLRHHWATVATARVLQPGPDDRFSYNVFNVTRDDLARIRDVQARAYREIRGIVDASEPEVTALWTASLVAWDPATEA